MRLRVSIAMLSSPPKYLNTNKPVGPTNLFNPNTPGLWSANSEEEETWDSLPVFLPTNSCVTLKQITQILLRLSRFQQALHIALNLEAVWVTSLPHQSLKEVSTESKTFRKCISKEEPLFEMLGQFW